MPQFPSEDSKLRATALQVRRGGNCSNTLDVLQQLLAAPSLVKQHSNGLKAHLVSCLPDAQATATHKILSSFGPANAGENIDFSYCLYRGGYTEPASSYIIRSGETGSRTIVNFNDLPEMTAAEFEEIANDFTGQGEEKECWWHFEVGFLVSSTSRLADRKALRLR